jgi:uncharacterized protein YndB with AHSA1/START domain
MSAGKENNTTVERTSEREMAVTRTFDGPARLVFKAWTTAELFARWWIPKSIGLTLVSCEMDVRVGGTYRLMIRPPGSEQAMPFFGTYTDVIPNARIVWTNEEGGESGPVTTVTFEDRGVQTLVVVRDLYPSKQALDEAIASESMNGFDESFEQLDALLPTLG